MRLGEERHADRRRGKEDAQDERIEQDESQVVGPVKPLGDRQLTTGREDFPCSHDHKYTQEEVQVNGQFISENPVVPMHVPLSSNACFAIILPHIYYSIDYLND